MYVRQIFHNTVFYSSLYYYYTATDIISDIHTTLVPIVAVSTTNSTRAASDTTDTATTDC